MCVLVAPDGTKRKWKWQGSYVKFKWKCIKSRSNYTPEFMYEQGWRFHSIAQCRLRNPTMAYKTSIEGTRSTDGSQGST
jgi:hypothetical protein